MSLTRFLLIALVLGVASSGLAAGPTTAYRQQVDPALRGRYEQIASAPATAASAAALDQRLQLLDELVNATTLAMNGSGGATTRPAGATPSRARVDLFNSFTARFALGIKTDLIGADLDTLRAYYSACVSAAETHVFKLGADIPPDRAADAAACALIVRFLHVPDARWQPDDYQSLPQWLKQPDLAPVVSEFAKQLRRPVTSYSFGHPPGARDAALVDYLIRESSRASLRQGVETAADYLLSAAGIAEALGDKETALTCRARRAEIFEGLNQPARAAEELHTAMAAAKDSTSFGRIATLRLKALYAAKQDSGLLAELAELKSDPRCAAWRPHLLYIGWAAATRQRQTSAVEEYQKQFLEEFPAHPLGADMCFSAAMTALAAGRYDDATRLLQTLEERYPDSKKAKQSKDVLARLTAARSPTTVP
jgi:hypothetical protein